MRAACYGWKLEAGCSGDAECGPLSTVNDWWLGQQLIPAEMLVSLKFKYLCWYISLAATDPDLYENWYTINNVFLCPLLFCIFTVKTCFSGTDVILHIRHPLTYYFSLCLYLIFPLSLPLFHTHLFSSSFSPDSNRLKCPGTTPLRSNQAWVMRRVIGPLPPEQGQSLEDMIDHDRSTMAAWCQRGGMGAHGPPAVTLSHPTQLCISSYTHTHTNDMHAHICARLRTAQHAEALADIREHVKMTHANKATPCAPICACKNACIKAST